MRGKRLALVVGAVVLALALLAIFVVGCRDGGGETQAQWAVSEHHVFQSAVVTNTSGTALSTKYYSVVGVQVEGIVTGTVAFSGTIDGSTWYGVQAVNANDGAVATSTTSDGLFFLGVGGLRQVRCPVTGYTSGTITVSGFAYEQGGGVADVSLAAGSAVTVSSNVAPAGKAASSAYVQEPVSNTAAIVVLAAPGAGVSNVVGMVSWSYDATPTAGSLVIECGASTVFKVDTPTAGPGFFPFDPGLKCTANTAMTATLAAGGGSVNGIVNVHAWME